jgi:hypothetical protein
MNNVWSFGASSETAWVMLTQILDTAEANARSIQAAVTAEATIWSVFFDVFMGLAAPGLAKGIAALAKGLPANASNLEYRVALQTLDERQTERLFAAATKVGKEAIKANANALFGETDTDIFIRNLKSAFRKGTDAVNVDLPNRTDEELGVMAAIYDPSVSNEAHYIPIIKDLVSRFQRQVLPIGPPKRHRGGGRLMEFQWTTQTRIVWAQVGSAEYLVQIGLVQNGADVFSFETFIDSDLKDAAIARARELQPGEIQTLQSHDILYFPSTIPTNAARK